LDLRQGHRGNRRHAHLAISLYKEVALSNASKSSLPKLIVAAAVAESINASPKTVYKMAKSGRIPCLNFGGMIRFDPEQIQEWIDDHRQAA
jgi:excisionase family DNA binding protein